MNEVKDLVKVDYLKGLKQKEICDKYDISVNTLKSWVKRYKWADEKKKGALIKKRGAPFNNKNATGPPGNKNAVTTGEFENIFFDTLVDEEVALINSIKIEKKKLLEQEIQLLTIRERRMLKRIESLKHSKLTVVSVKSGIEKGMETELNESEGSLSQIQKIEDALTRVQGKKLKTVEMLHKFEIDNCKLELDVMKLELELLKQDIDENNTEDDGFIDALSSEVGDTWND